MNFYLPNKIKALSAVLLATVVLLLAVFVGAKAGQRQAVSGVIGKNAQAIAAGLKYFYSDYSRFPTAVEYQNQNLMLNYYSQFPPQDFASGQCSQSYAYKRNSNSSYQLNFCLPKAVGQYRSGWNQLDQSSTFLK